MVDEVFEADPGLPVIQITGPVEIPVDEADGFEFGPGTPQFNSTRGEKRTRSPSPLLSPTSPASPSTTRTPSQPSPLPTSDVSITPAPPGTPFVPRAPASPHLLLTPSILRSPTSTSTFSPSPQKLPPIPPLRLCKNAVSEWTSNEARRSARIQLKKRRH